MKNVSLRTRLLIIFGGLLTIALIVLTAGFALSLGNLTLDAEADRIDGLLFASSAQLSREVWGEEVVQVLEEGSLDSEMGEYITDSLYAVWDIDPNINRAYVLAPDPNNVDQLVFVVLGIFDEEGNMTIQEEMLGQPFEPYEVLDAEMNGETPWMEAFDDEIVLVDTLNPEGRDFTSGYAPLYDESFNIVAIAGVDSDAQDFILAENTLLTVVGASVLVVLPLLIGAVFVVSNSITEPVRLLDQATVALEKEDSNFDPAVLAPILGRGDELGRLAEHFNKMAEEIQAREKRLKEQVAELKIEIDEAKREQQVSEIADTDYFRELQAKAKEMRKKDKSADESPE